MKKSVYSLVLMDDIVAAIDQLAYAQGTSRSNLINQILAEKVALITPEQRLQSLFDELSAYLRPYSHFQIQQQAADHMYSIKSALRYKYNPTIRYSFYINGQGKHLTGDLRIISRTQSEVLLSYLEQFFKLWAAIEREKATVKWEREEGAKWHRTLQLNDFETLANDLSEYIQVLDESLKLYFAQIERGQMDPLVIQRHYENYYRQLRKPI